MLKFFDTYNHAGYSQNGEQGLLQECIKRLNITGIAVEFGAPTRSYYSNIFHLIKTWKCFYYDNNPQETEIEAATITPENINQTIPECNILSIDIDMEDYNVWKAYNGKPDIVIIEINSGIHPEDKVICEPNLGTSYRPMVELAIEKGYFLLCHTGNLIFVKDEHKELFPEVNKSPLTEYQYYFRTQFLHDHVEKWEEKR